MSRAERILVVALCLAVGGFHVWTVWSSGDDLRPGGAKNDYYNRLVAGWLDGHLHMKTDVPAALLALKNPYDPAQRPAGLGLHDASLFRGKYYVYFGVAPVVTLMLPWRLATGTDLPLGIAVLVFAELGFLASVAIFCAMRRRYFPKAGKLTLAIGVLTLGCCGAWLALLRRPHMWELPIAGGYAFAMLALLALWRGLHAERGRAGWLAAAALALGLAIASRPTYLFAMPLFAAPLLWWLRKEKRWPGSEVLAVIAPLAIVGAAMAWHNWARFGSPLEFGQAYQLSLDYESKLPHFAARYVPLTVWAHFLNPAEWQGWFPFIGSRGLGAGPLGFTPHRGDVYGVLVSYPIAWLALLAPLALRWRTAAERGPLGAWLAAAALLFGGAAAVMLLFFSALSRYQVDFMPAFMVLTIVGLLAAERELTPRWRRIAGAAAAVAATYGVVFGVLFSLSFDGLLKERNPALERTVARRLNGVAAGVERVLGVEHGPIELTVRWPAMRAKGDEILASIGREPLVDRVIARHLGDGRVQLGLAPAGAAERFGKSIAPAPDAPHRIRVTLASLFPPGTHPYFDGRTPAEIRATLRRAEIAVDGEVVLREHLRLARGGAGEVRVARLDQWRRVPEQPAEQTAPPPPGDTLRLRVRLRPQPPGTREPLVVTGCSGAGEFILVEHLAGGAVRISLDSWGAPPRHGGAVTPDFAAEHELLITHGALATVNDATAARRVPAAAVRVTFDGRVVLEDRAEFHPAEHAEVYVGRNPIGGTSCGPVFSGEILAAERIVRE